MTRKIKWYKVNIPIMDEIENKPVPIVADPGIATVDIPERGLLPMLVIDTSLRPDIDDMFEVHEQVGVGDIEIAWAKSDRGSRYIKLLLMFKRPSKCMIVLELDIVKQGIIIDRIVKEQGLYLQCGREGETLRSSIDNPKILIDVEQGEFNDAWDAMLRDELTKYAKREQGLSRRESKEYVEHVISVLKGMGKIRLPDTKREGKSGKQNN